MSREITTIPAEIRAGVFADASPWNEAPHRPYVLPVRVKVLNVRAGVSASGVEVLVDTGDSLLGERWMDAGWFKWVHTNFLVG